MTSVWPPELNQFNVTKCNNMGNFLQRYSASNLSKGGVDALDRSVWVPVTSAHLPKHNYHFIPIPSTYSTVEANSIMVSCPPCLTLRPPFVCSTVRWSLWHLQTCKCNVFQWSKDVKKLNIHVMVLDFTSIHSQTPMPRLRFPGSAESGARTRSAGPMNFSGLVGWK